MPKEIIIEELERENTLKNKPWSERDMAILVKYYSKWGAKPLLKHIPNRTIAAINGKAQNLGLKYEGR